MESTPKRFRLIQAKYWKKSSKKHRDGANGPNSLAPSTLDPLQLGPVPSPGECMKTTPDTVPPTGYGMVPVGSPSGQTPAGGYGGHAQFNASGYPPPWGPTTTYGYDNGVTLDLNRPQQQGTWGSQSQNGQIGPDTTASMLQSQPGGRYQHKFSEDRDILKAQGELQGTSTRQRSAELLGGSVGGPLGGAHEVSGVSTQRRLQMDTANAGANAAWRQLSNPKPLDGPPTSLPAAGVTSRASFYGTPGQPRQGTLVLPVQPSMTTMATPTNIETSHPDEGTVDKGLWPGPQVLSSNLPRETPTPRAPAQNESRRRQGSGDPPALQEKISTPTPLPLPPTLTPLPQAAAGDSDSRIRDFLESHHVTKQDPGFDWLSTLINWIARDQQKHESKFQDNQKQVQIQLGNAQESLRQEKQLAEKLGREIRDKNTQISQLTTDHATAKEGEAKWEKAWLKVGSELKEMQASREKHRKHAKSLDDEVGHLTAELETSRRHAADWEAKTNSADERCRMASLDLGNANTQIEELKKANRTLTRDKENKTRQIGELLAQVQILNNKLDGIHTQHANEVDAIHAEHADKLAARDDDILRLNTEHRSELAAKDHQLSLLTAKHEEDLVAKDSHMALLVDQYEQKLTDLEGSVNFKIDEATRRDRATIGKQKQQIASYNKDDYVPIDDAAFTRSFQALVQDVNQLASQIRQPTTIDFDPSLDPTSCLDRNADQRSWIWPRFVRNLCWNVLLRGFFSLPFGFGALGSQGEGYRILYPTYQAMAQVNPDGRSHLHPCRSQRWPMLNMLRRVRIRPSDSQRPKDQRGSGLAFREGPCRSPL